MNHLKKYSFRLGVGFMIYFFLHLSHVPSLSDLFRLEAIDRAMMLVTVVTVLVAWWIVDQLFRRFECRGYNFTQSSYLIKALVILTLATFPTITAACLFSDYVIKPLLNCPVIPEAMYLEMAQGQVFAWLIIAARLVRLNSLHIKKLEKDKALMQKELLQSQYQNLKNQINPHFLFNSFSVLQTLIETDPSKASEFLTKLSSMYRYLLENKEEGMSSVQKEIDVLKVYLYLLKTRHEDSLAVKVTIDEKYNQSFLPSLALQMLVENAVKHNRFSKKEPLLIEIFVEDQFLVVRNTVKRKGSEVISTKVGLENIRSQYQLQSDKPVVVIEDEQFFTVKIPVLNRLKLA